MTRAPSRNLALAAEASELGGSGEARSRHAVDDVDTVHARKEAAELPGPLERTLRGIGVTRPDLLRRATELDRVGERLVIEAATDECAVTGKQHEIVVLNKSASTAAHIDHALASGESQVTALLRRCAMPKREPPEAEP
jgi:hypothetical protein